MHIKKLKKKMGNSNVLPLTWVAHLRLIVHSRQILWHSHTRGVSRTSYPLFITSILVVINLSKKKKHSKNGGEIFLESQ